MKKYRQQQNKIGSPIMGCRFFGVSIVAVLATVAASAAPFRTVGMLSVLPPIPLKFADILFAIPAIFLTIPEIFSAVPTIFPAVPAIFGAIKPLTRMPSFIAIQFAIIIAIKAF